MIDLNQLKYIYLLRWSLLVESWCHIFIGVGGRSRSAHGLERIHWLCWSSTSECIAVNITVVVVNLNKLAAVVSTLPLSTSTPVLAEHGQPMLLLVPYLGCVRLALRIRRPWAVVAELVLLLDGCATGLDGGGDGDKKKKKRVVSCGLLDRDRDWRDVCRWIAL